MRSVESRVPIIAEAQTTAVSTQSIAYVDPKKAAASQQELIAVDKKWARSATIAYFYHLIPAVIIMILFQVYQKIFLKNEFFAILLGFIIPTLFCPVVFFFGLVFLNLHKVSPKICIFLSISFSWLLPISICIKSHAYIIALAMFLFFVSEMSSIFCNKNRLKLGIMLSKVSISTICNRKIKITKKLSMVILKGYACIGASYSLLLMTLRLYSSFNANTYTTETPPLIAKAVIVLILIIGILSKIYITDLFSAVCFITGASIYNEYTKNIVENKEIERPKKKDIVKIASDIAQRTSYGSACRGAASFNSFWLLIKACSFLKNLISRTEQPEFKGDTSALTYTYIALYGKDLKESERIALQSFTGANLSRYKTDSVLRQNFFFPGLISCLLLGLFIFLFFLPIYNIYVLVKGKTASLAILIFLEIKLRNFYLMNGIEHLISGASAAQIAILVDDPERSVRTHPEKERFEKLIEQLQG